MSGHFTPTGYVKMPTTAEEARAMASLGLAWLSQNAPELLKAPAARQPVAEVIAHPGWRTEYVPLIVPLPAAKLLPAGTKLYAGPSA